MTLDYFNAFTVTVTPQSVLWKYTWPFTWCTINTHGWMVIVHCCNILHQVNTLWSRLNMDYSCTTKYFLTNQIEKTTTKVIFQGWIQRGCLRGWHLKPNFWTERCKPRAGERVLEGVQRGGFNTPLSLEGVGGPPPDFFNNLCLWECILSHFEAHFAIFYILNFK